MRVYQLNQEEMLVRGTHGVGAIARPLRARRTQPRWHLHLVAAALLVLGLAWLLAQHRQASGPSASAGSTERASDSLQSPAGQGGAPHESPAVFAAPAAVPAPPPSGWLQNFRPANLWSGPGADAASLGELSQWHYLRSLGGAEGDRLQVEAQGDGRARLPLRGWVDAGAVGPSGPPPVEWRLATETDLSAAPRWRGTAWPQGISAEFAAVVDGDSGELLYGKDPHGRVAPASLTKIATAIAALENANLTDTVSVRVNAAEMAESTVMGLSPGERVSLRTLLYGLMLPSGNDAALAIAQHVGGSEARFVEMMNALVARLELKNTHFANPHGLDQSGHYSSPYDMSTLARYGMRDPNFATLAGARLFEAEGYTLYNLNRLLWSYEGADGVKPGFTDAAGRAVVGSATRAGHRVFVTLMRSPDLWGDCIGLLDYAFRSFHWG
jgi:D-alanyl-D-alanine carboxypeptidase (penicillin-binding protein 5/6)